AIMVHTEDGQRVGGPQSSRHRGGLWAVGQREGVRVRDAFRAQVESRDGGVAMDPSYIVIGASGGLGKYIHASLPNAIGTYYKHPSGLLVPLDITNEEEVRCFTDGTEGTRIVLVNASGITRNGIAHKADLSSWRNVVETNLIGSFSTFKQFL